MATNEFGELSQKKYYATERLTEIKQDLLRLATENNELKATLNSGVEDKKAIALARRRRSYLAARSAKLKEERDMLKADLETVKAELSALDIERRKAKVDAT